MRVAKDDIGDHAASFHFAALPPLSLYIHTPWCVRKCPYCDFNSHALRGAAPENEYIDALLADLRQELPRVWGRVIQSVFIGGGTPSLFPPEAIERLLSHIRALLPLQPDGEITLEANPGAIDAVRFAGYRQAGINRLSIGIQSFEPEKLHALGRIHDRDEALRAVELARAAGFDNINLDLMYGLPGQSIEQAVRDLMIAMELEPAHLSIYQLTIEPNTLFHTRRPLLPDEDTLWEMQRVLHAMLSTNDYHQYEVSAFSLRGRECSHNLNYWRFGDYLGIGAGAHGKVSDREGVTRTRKVRRPLEYMQRAGKPAAIAGVQRLQPHEIRLEFMMNALRLIHGFPDSLFRERTGLPLTVADAPLSLAYEQELITREPGRVRPTELGRRYLNTLLELFF